MAKKPITKVKQQQQSELLQIVCETCGEAKSETEFYTSKYSDFFNINKKIVPICRECANKALEELKAKYDEITALFILCARFDLYFSVDIYATTIKNTNNFTLGLYLRQLQRVQYSKKSFQTSVTTREFLKFKTSDKEISKAKMNKEDKQNMNYVISTVGYDPFDNCGLNDEDRRYCYNLMAGYCDIDGIKDDGHKIVCCVQIVQSQLQIKKLNEELNQALENGNFDENKVNKLTASKRVLSDSVAKIAQDNNISSKYNDNSKRGKNTLSQKMKDMLADGYEAVRVNLFDIKTSEAIKQVADISNKSIMEQLALDSNDYADMVKKQREMLVDIQEKYDVLEEQNRNLQNELEDLKLQKQKKGG